MTGLGGRLPDFPQTCQPIIDRALDTIADYVFSGYGVTSGDVNNDDYSDAITSGGGKTRIHFGGTTMDTIPDIVITEFSGRASTGYFNKDIGQDKR